MLVNYLFWSVPLIHRRRPVELRQYMNVGGGPAPRNEVTERASVGYEEIDRLREMRQQPHSPIKSIELTQNAAYRLRDCDTT